MSEKEERLISFVKMVNRMSWSMTTPSGKIIPLPKKQLEEWYKKFELFFKA